MKTVKADLHIHTVLSPCGDLDMSPRNIVARALEEDLQIIGITDHNSTRQIEVVQKLAADAGIFVLPGVEITTREEVHCLAFFPDFQALNEFQTYLDTHLPNIPNNTDIFGYQVVVDENDLITYTEPKLLITALNQSVNQIEEKVHSLNGIFIPAHINKMVNSIFSQLGFIPPGLRFEALEITCCTTQNAVRNNYLIPENAILMINSDAHFPADIGKGYSLLTLAGCSFQEVKSALAGEAGRSIKNGLK